MPRVKHRLDVLISHVAHASQHTSHHTHIASRATYTLNHILHHHHTLHHTSLTHTLFTHRNTHHIIIHITSSHIASHITSQTSHHPRTLHHRTTHCIFTETYMLLDVDKNGLLSREELMNYGGRGFTTVFVDRVFAECPTYDDEMVRARQHTLLVPPLLSPSYSNSTNSFWQHARSIVRRYYYYHLLEHPHPGHSLLFYPQDFKAFVDFVLALENNKTRQVWAGVVLHSPLLQFLLNHTKRIHIRPHAHIHTHRECNISGGSWTYESWGTLRFLRSTISSVL